MNEAYDERPLAGPENKYLRDMMDEHRARRRVWAVTAAAAAAGGGIAAAATFIAQWFGAKGHP